MPLHPTWHSMMMASRLHENERMQRRSIDRERDLPISCDMERGRRSLTQVRSTAVMVVWSINQVQFEKRQEVADLGEEER